jgi:uncharacterized protein
MSVARELHQLQLLDSERDAKAQRLTEVEAELGETEDLVQARAAIAETQAELDRLRAQLRALELDVGAVSAKLKANQERLYGGRVRNPKELSGLHEEAAALRRRRSELEDQQLEFMIDVEAQEAELAERQARQQQIETTWRQDQAALEAEGQQLLAALAGLDGEIEHKRAAIRRPDLALYDDLRARLGGRAVAQLRRGICQVCGVDLPTGQAWEVERGEGLHFCPTCNRLLYGG